MIFNNHIENSNDICIFMNHHYNETYTGNRILSDQEGDIYMYPQDVDPEKLTHFLIKLPEINPDILVVKFPNIKKIPVNYQIMKGYVTENCIRMILL